MTRVPIRPRFVRVKARDIMQAGDEYKPWHWHSWTPIPVSYYGHAKHDRVHHTCSMRRPQNAAALPPR